MNASKRQLALLDELKSGAGAMNQKHEAEESEASNFGGLPQVLLMAARKNGP